MKSVNLLEGETGTVIIIGACDRDHCHEKRPQQMRTIVFNLRDIHYVMILNTATGVPASCSSILMCLFINYKL